MKDLVENIRKPNDLRGLESTFDLGSLLNLWNQILRIADQVDNFLGEIIWGLPQDEPQRIKIESQWDQAILENRINE